MGCAVWVHGMKLCMSANTMRETRQTTPQLAVQTSVWQLENADLYAANVAL